MNILNYFDSPRKKQNVEYLIHLVRISMADEVINESEMRLAHSFAIISGFDENKFQSYRLF
jgi:hypothetical protein